MLHLGKSAINDCKSEWEKPENEARKQGKQRQHGTVWSWHSFTGKDSQGHVLAGHMEHPSHIGTAGGGTRNELENQLSLISYSSLVNFSLTS